MTVAEIRAKVRRLTRTNSTTYTDANILIDINIAQEKVVAEIVKNATYANEFVVEKYYDLKAIDNLSAGDIGYKGEYPFEDGTIRPLRVEVGYETSGTVTYRPTTIGALTQSGKSAFNEDDINSEFSQSSPVVFFLRNSYFIRPLLDGTDDVAAGLHLWWLDQPADVTSDSDEPAGNTIIHDVYPHIVAMEYYKENPEKYNALTEKGYNEALDRLKNFYSQRMNYQRQVRPINYNFK